MKGVICSVICYVMCNMYTTYCVSIGIFVIRGDARCMNMIVCSLFMNSYPRAYKQYGFIVVRIYTCIYVYTYIHLLHIDFLHIRAWAHVGPVEPLKARALEGPGGPLSPGPGA